MKQNQSSTRYYTQQDIDKLKEKVKQVGHFFMRVLIAPVLCLQLMVYIITLNEDNIKIARDCLSHLLKNIEENKRSYD